MKAGGQSCHLSVYCGEADALGCIALLPDDIVLKLVEPELRALKDKVGTPPSYYLDAHTDTTLTGLDP